MSDTTHPNYEAGRRATKYVYGVEPDLTREGGSIPVTLVLQVKALTLVVGHITGDRVRGQCTCMAS